MDPNALLLFAVLIAAFYLLLVRPARQRQKEQAATVSKVVPGVRVMTTAGLFGTVTAVDGDQIDLEIAPGVTVRYVAAAVARIIEDPEPAAEEPETPSEGSEAAEGTTETPEASLPEDDTPGA